ncbi:MAG: hypothetical protein CVV05_05320 [Gammaproteobacteria bacterium HGW-Gammaproteobacteria-1]|nr:MAG: hypothetical protein CVV05_05320 [Gammaproteobacteria bacterium HGW-Gammaproteobacteria-1]
MVLLACLAALARIRFFLLQTPRSNEAGVAMATALLIDPAQGMRGIPMPYFSLQPLRSRPS